MCSSGLHTGHDLRDARLRAAGSQSGRDHPEGDRGRGHVQGLAERNHAAHVGKPLRNVR